MRSIDHKSLITLKTKHDVTVTFGWQDSTIYHPTFGVRAIEVLTRLLGCKDSSESLLLAGTVCDKISCVRPFSRNAIQKQYSSAILFRNALQYYSEML